MNPIMNIFLILTTVAAACCNPQATGLPASNFVYPQYALRYVSLGQQRANLNGVSGQGTYNTAEQQGYVRYVTYTTDGTNIYRTIVRVKPGSYPEALSPAMQSRPLTVSTQETSDAATQTAEDEVHPMTDGKENHSTDTVTHEITEKKVQQTTDTAINQPTEDTSAGTIDNVPDINIRMAWDDDEEEDTAGNHSSEEIAPPTSETNAEDDLLDKAVSRILMDFESTSTLPPFPEEFIPEVEEISKVEDDEILKKLPLIKDNENNAILDSEKDVNGNSFATKETKTRPTYLATPYGTIALYPYYAYNAYINQRNSLIKLSSSLSGMLPSAIPTMASIGDKNPTTNSIQTTVPTTPSAASFVFPTARPSSVAIGISTIRPSSVPIGITTSGSPISIRPISYIYPYMRYQNQNSGIVYQVPQQQMRTSQQFIRWSGGSQPTYQSTYPQGYMSYQSPVLALSVSPSNQKVEPKMLVEPTMHAHEN